MTYTITLIMESCTLLVHLYALERDYTLKWASCLICIIIAWTFIFYIIEWYGFLLILPKLYFFEVIWFSFVPQQTVHSVIGHIILYNGNYQ